MTTSFAPPDVDEHELAAIGRRIGETVTGSTQLRGGRNNAVYRLRCGSGRTVVLKRCFSQELGDRRRLEVEFGTVAFLWGAGVRSVPQPLDADPERGWALYAHIEGVPVVSGEVTESDIARAVAFLSRIYALRTAPGANALPWASEACRAPGELVRVIRERLGRFEMVERQDDGAQLHAWLSDAFHPALARTVAWSQAQLAAVGRGWEQVLPDTERTLSPSDFGFHNALRQANGELVFLDFEYFGWDDPAKMISDVLLHPGMTLSRTQTERLDAGMRGIFASQGDLSARVEAIQPMCGLNWCLIFLNEFRPEYVARRAFASGQAIDRAAVRQQQFAKAQRMLERVMQMTDGSTRNG